jgi:hypothetical protein
MKLLINIILAIAFATLSWGQSPTPQEAAIPASLAEKIYRPQKRSTTCWAACNSMLLAAEGIDSSEEDQINRMSQFLPDRGLNGAGAHFQHASQALRGKYGDRTVKVWFMDRRVPPVDASMNKKFVALIEKGQPAITATPQHGMVAIAVRYTVLPNGIYQILGFKVNDPIPAAGNSRWLTPEESLAVFGFMAIVKTEKAENSQVKMKDSENREMRKAKVNLAGTWQGEISQLGIKVVFRINKEEDGYTAKTDSPDQNAYGIKTEITVSEADVELEIRTLNPASFSGTLRGKTLDGTFSQGGQEWPLKLKRE